MTSKPQRQKEAEDHGAAKSVAAPAVTAALEGTQVAKYHTKGGHGFAAEDANNLADRLRGKKATLVGGCNERNGADRVVDGVSVQSKYYENAGATLRAAFDPSSGTYRYSGQVLEVPKDQYDECVARMRSRIQKGDVPGHTNPADAEDLVKKGTVTYKQARNIARAGNIDSIVFDAKTGAALASGVFGLSFAINYWQGHRRGLNDREAVSVAFQEAFATGATTVAVHVVSAQLLRTRAAAAATVALRPIVRSAARTPLGKKLVEGAAAGACGRAVHGAAAVNSVAKALRSNVVTGTVTAVVTCTPDFYRAAFDKSISWQQFLKNSAVNVAGVAGGIGGWMAGAGCGASIGSAVSVIGTAAGALVGGVLGGLGGSFGASKGARALADSFVEDDAKALRKALETELAQLAEEYLLSKDEFDEVIAKVCNEVDDAWLRKMFKKSRAEAVAGRAFVRRQFEESFAMIAERRPKVSGPSSKLFRRQAKQLCGLYIDPATGELRTRTDDVDRVPATRMAREGFFAGGASRGPATTLRIVQVLAVSGIVGYMAARAGGFQRQDLKEAS